jgi:hypothetical protein
MRTLVTAAATTLAIVALPASAKADHADCSHKLERTYSKDYRAVARQHGTRAPGRNIRKWGVLFKGTVFDATCGELRRSRAQLRKLLTAPPLMRSNPVPPAQPPAGVKSDFDTATLPACTWQPESGGDYNAVNASSGARGKYQIMPSTHDGLCPDLGWDPGGQEACAVRIWKEQGAGAWVNC